MPLSPPLRQSGWDQGQVRPAASLPCRQVQDQLRCQDTQLSNATSLTLGLALGKVYVFFLTKAALALVSAVTEVRLFRRVPALSDAQTQHSS